MVRTEKTRLQQNSIPGSSSGTSDQPYIMLHTCSQILNSQMSNLRRFMLDNILIKNEVAFDLQLPYCDLISSSACVIQITHNLSQHRSSLVAQTVKDLPAMWETWVQSLCSEDPLEEGMATHSSLLAWRIPWTEETGRLQSTGSQKAGHD